MRKIRIMAHISLDGVIHPEDAQTHGEWTSPYRSPDGAAALAEAQGRGFDLLLGRHTYDLWSRFWPGVKGGPFAEDLNAATKHVATHRPAGLEWGPVETLGADIVESIRQLKSQDGPDLLVWGSTTLTPILFGEGLADDVVLVVYPVLLGRGKRFFPDDADPQRLSLVSTTTTSTKVLLNSYHYLGALAARSPAEANA